MSPRAAHFSSDRRFGVLLKQLHKRAGMTQRDLAAALGYSDSLISSRDKAQRQPDLDAVIQRFIPALGLQDDGAMANRLIACAAAVRGTRPAPTGPVKLATPLVGAGVYAETAESLPALPIALIGHTATIQHLGNPLVGHLSSSHKYSTVEAGNASRYFARRSRLDPTHSSQVAA